MGEMTIETCGRCGRFADSCICGIRRGHDANCKMRRAMESSVGIECDHGYDVCPICDPCTCAAQDGNPHSEGNTTQA